MQLLVIFLVPLLFMAHGVVMLAMGRGQEAKRSLALGVSMAAFLAVFLRVPRNLAEQLVLVSERLFAGGELLVLATWPIRSQRAGQTESTINRSSSEWKTMALLALGAALGAVADLLDVETVLHAVPLAIVAVTSVCLAVLEARVGTRVTTNGILQVTRFTPWSGVTGATLERDDLILKTKDRFRSLINLEWLGSGARRIQGSKEVLEMLLQKVQRPQVDAGTSGPAAS